jgi:hypothetical protein
MIGFIAPYTFTHSGEQVIQRHRYSTHFPVHRYTRTRLSVFTSRILATDLSQSHSNFITHEVFLSQSNSFLANAAVANSEDSTRLLSTAVLYTVSSSDCALL